MSILFTAIVQGEEIISSHGPSLRNGLDITHLVLSKIDLEGSSKQTFLWHDYEIDYLTQPPFTILAITRSGINRRSIFQFLSTVHASVTEPSATIKTNELLKDEVEKFERDPSASDQVQRELEQVKTIMTQNIDRVLERGERIDLLIDKSAQLQSSSLQFRKKSREVRKSMWWQKVRTTALIGSSVVIVTYFLVGAECGLPLFDQCL